MDVSPDFRASKRASYTKTYCSCKDSQEGSVIHPNHLICAFACITKECLNVWRVLAAPPLTCVCTMFTLLVLICCTQLCTSTCPSTLAWSIRQSRAMNVPVLPTPALWKHTGETLSSTFPTWPHCIYSVYCINPMRNLKILCRCILNSKDDSICFYNPHGSSKVDPQN